MTKEELKKHLLDLEGFDFEAFEFENEFSAKGILKAMDEYAQQAVAEHEDSQWKPYPENLPDWGKKYWAHNTFGHESSCYGREFDAICVIAFRELPASFKGKEERK